jgi:hypothetical protein
MTVSLSLFAGAGWQFFDNNGNVLSGGLLYSYEAGTTTPLATYTSSTGATANTNPIVLNAGGRPANEIWLDVTKTAKFILKDSLGSTIGTWDNIPSIVSAFNLSGTNNGVAYFNSSGVFGSSANFTFDGSNIDVAGEIASGGDANIGGDANVAGNAVVTGTIASAGGLTSATPAVTQTAGDNSTKIATTAFVQSNLKSAILPLTASVASNQLTLTLAPTRLDFRSSTLNDGSVSTVSSSTLTLTVPNGTTLGTTNGVAARLAVLAVYDGSTVQLAVNNLAGGVKLDETNLVTTTTSGSSSTAIYAASAVTNKPYRIVGLVDITEATAGTWATAPTTVQGIGGEPLAAMSSIGFGQTYNTFTDPGVSTPTYNTSGKPQFMTCVITCAAGSGNMVITCNGVTLANIYAGNATSQGSAFWIVPVGASWQYTVSGSALSRTFVLLS